MGLVATWLDKEVASFTGLSAMLQSLPKGLPSTDCPRICRYPFVCQDYTNTYFDINQTYSVKHDLEVLPFIVDVTELTPATRQQKYVCHLPDLIASHLKVS